MRVKVDSVRRLYCGAVIVALLAAAVSGCAPTAASPTATPNGTSLAPDAIVGRYSIEFRTTESDRETTTGETILRDAQVTGSCSGNTCDLSLTIELKAPDGSTTSGVTALTFDGTAYHGAQSSTFACDGLTSLTTIENGLAYTSDTTITPASTTTDGGTAVVTAFDIVIVERNEVTAEGRSAGCPAINPSGADPYVSNATTVGVSTRQP